MLYLYPNYVYSIFVVQLCLFHDVSSLSVFILVFVYNFCSIVFSALFMSIYICHVPIKTSYLLTYNIQQLGLNYYQMSTHLIHLSCLSFDSRVKLVLNLSVLARAYIICMASRHSISVYCSV